MANEHYELINQYLDRRFLELSKAKKDTGFIDVNVSYLTLAQEAYEYGVKQDFPRAKVRDMVSVFIERTFGEKEARRALSRLETK